MFPNQPGGTLVEPWFVVEPYLKPPRSHSRFFAILFGPARPSAGIGVVEVQKLKVFCDFVLARATLCGDRRGRGAKTRGFL